MFPKTQLTACTLTQSRRRAHTRRTMAHVLLDANQEDLANALAPYLDQKTLGKWSTVCKTTATWPELQNRKLALRLHDPSLGVQEAPTPHTMFKAKDNDEPLLTVEGTAQRRLLKMKPVAVCKYDARVERSVETLRKLADAKLEAAENRIENGDDSNAAQNDLAAAQREADQANDRCDAADDNKGPTSQWFDEKVTEVLPWGSGVNVDRTDCTIELVNAADGEALEHIETFRGFTGTTEPKQLKFRINQLSKHYEPRGSFRVRATFHVALHTQPHSARNTYTAESVPLDVVSHIPSAKSIAYSHRRKRPRE